jgi:hypothetical protein
MNMANLEVAPKAIEPLDSLKPYGLNAWYPNTQAAHPIFGNSVWVNSTAASVTALSMSLHDRRWGPILPVACSAQAGGEESRLGSAVRV